MLTEAELDYRRGKATSSMMPILMGTTSEAALLHFWKVCVGLEPPEPENWAMIVGTIMEKPILDWREKQTGQPITRRGEIVDHPARPKDFCAKLDGYRAAEDRITEVKTVGSWRKPDEFVPYYYPQVVWQMLCTGAQCGSLLVSQGITSEPVEFEIEFSQAYADEMLKRADAFVKCMRTFTPPVSLPPVTVTPPEKWRTVDIDVDPTNWGEQLRQYLETFGATAEAAELHEQSGKDARSLVPEDVGKVIAGPWRLNRNKKGVVSITSGRSQ